MEAPIDRTTDVMNYPHDPERFDYGQLDIFAASFCEKIGANLLTLRSFFARKIPEWVAEGYLDEFANMLVSSYTNVGPISQDRQQFFKEFIPVWYDMNKKATQQLLNRGFMIIMMRQISGDTIGIFVSEYLAYVNSEQQIQWITTVLQTPTPEMIINPTDFTQFFWGVTPTFLGSPVDCWGYESDLDSVG